MTSPIEALKSVEPAERKQRALGDEILRWAVRLDDLALARAAVELKAIGAAPAGWVAQVKALRKKQRAEQRPSHQGWEQRLRRSPDTGKPLASPFNLELICNHWEPLATLRLNELTLRAELEGQPMKSGDTHNWAARIESTFDFAVPLTSLDAAFEAAAEARAYHPVKDYLDGLVWDGKQRIAYVCRDILDNADPLSWRMFECFVVASVARTYQRGEEAKKLGVQADNMFTLFSAEQGRRKTSFFRVLFDGSVYVGHIDPTKPDCIMAIATKRCALIDEVDEFVGRHEWPAIKRTIGQTGFDFRAPYARRGAHHFARHVWGATTNRDDILRDDTGHRRIHIVSVGPADLDSRMKKLEEWRDQIWAEARAIYEDGVDEQGNPRLYLWWLNPDEEAQRAQKAADFEEFGVLDEKVSAYAAGKNEIRMMDLLQHGLDIEPARLMNQRPLENKIGGILAKLGWKSQRVREGEGNEKKQRRVWRRREEQ